MSAREERRTIRMIGCDHRIQGVLIDNRYFRWRCTHHRCPEAMEAKRRGLHCYHIDDWETGERLESEFEEPQLRLAG